MMTDILWKSFEIIVNLYQSVMTIYFPYKLLGEKNNSSKRAWFVTASLVHFIVLMSQDKIAIADNWFTLLYFAISFIYSCIALRGNYVKKVIGSTMPLILLSIVGIFTLDFCSAVSGIPAIELVQDKGIIRILLVLSVQILIFIVFKIFLDLLCSADDSYLLRDWLKVVIIAALSLTMGALLHNILLYEYDKSVHLTASILLAILFITDMFFFSLITSMIRKNRQIREMELNKIQQDYLKKVINEISDQYNSIRKIRHNVKDTYQTLFSLLADKKTEEAKQLISENYDIIDHIGIHVKTNNDFLNAVVNAKFTAASTFGIKVSCITVNDVTGILDIDLCDLLNNMLENAITACKEIPEGRSKHLYLKIDKENDTYTFLVKNSIDHSVMSSNPKLETTKSDKKKHGFGMAIIQEIAQKYNGRCDFYESEEMFCCQVVLMADKKALS